MPKSPPGALRVSGAELPPNLKRFGRFAAAHQTGAEFRRDPLAISFPPDRAEVEMVSGTEPDPLPLKAEGGALPLTWLVDGKLENRSGVIHVITGRITDLSSEVRGLDLRTRDFR